eukprot:CAMPEP_0198659652 /NCGR_PEP_ID=MMETSP1467-20131203/33135_1 /TAXON_ID=1462469 /ORGANISM="unid. sp., Strain CCMP2135" /LENGTH=197 /DNA_ID=CAMNT_0044396023 /DNA_START=123 /DNA_END=712 /DNA_ORIENTATION=-
MRQKPTTIPMMPMSSPTDKPVLFSTRIRCEVRCVGIKDVVGDGDGTKDTVGAAVAADGDAKDRLDVEQLKSAGAAPGNDGLAGHKRDREVPVAGERRDVSIIHAPMIGAPLEALTAPRLLRTEGDVDVLRRRKEVAAGDDDIQLRRHDERRERRRLKRHRAPLVIAPSFDCKRLPRQRLSRRSSPPRREPSKQQDRH